MFPSRPAVVLAAVTLLAVSTVLVVPAVAQDKEDPIVAKVKASLKDPTKPFTMLVSLQAKPGTGDKVEKVFVPAIKLTRKEKGCVTYDLSRDTKAPSQYLLYERWQSLATLEAHLKAPHITALLKELGELLAGPPELRVLLPAAE